MGPRNSRGSSNPQAFSFSRTRRALGDGAARALKTRSTPHSRSQSRKRGRPACRRLLPPARRRWRAGRRAWLWGLRLLRRERLRARAGGLERASADLHRPPPVAITSTWALLASTSIGAAVESRSAAITFGGRAGAATVGGAAWTQVETEPVCGPRSNADAGPGENFFASELGKRLVRQGMPTLAPSTLVLFFRVLQGDDHQGRVATAFRSRGVAEGKLCLGEFGGARLVVYDRGCRLCGTMGIRVAEPASAVPTLRAAVQPRAGALKAESLSGKSGQRAWTPALKEGANPACARDRSPPQSPRLCAARALDMRGQTPACARDHRHSQSP